MEMAPTPCDACGKVSTRATSISMVRYRNNDCPAPGAHAHHEVQVRGHVHDVVIGCGAEVIACHRRSCGKADMVFDPMRCLPLLEQGAGAPDQAAPLKGRDLPDRFATPHRLPEARTGKNGKRELCADPALAGDLREESVEPGSCSCRLAAPIRTLSGWRSRNPGPDCEKPKPEPSKTFGKPLETYVTPAPRKNAGTIPKPQDIACSQTHDAPVAGGLPDACGRCPTMPVSVGAPPDKPDHALFPSSQEALRSRNGLSGIYRYRPMAPEGTFPFHCQ